LRERHHNGPSRPRGFVLAALYQQFCARKELVISGVITVEVPTDYRSATI
jgi:hypothetical protein